MTNPETQRAQDAAVDAAAGRTITPTPAGLCGRVVAEHDAGIEALAIGDVDSACGHDIAAKALGDALFAERREEPSTRTAII